MQFNQSGERCLMKLPDRFVARLSLYPSCLQPPVVRLGLGEGSLSKFPQSAPLPCLLSFDSLTNYFVVLSLDLEEVTASLPPLRAAECCLMEG